MKNSSRERAITTLRNEQKALTALNKILDKNFDKAISLLSARAGRIIVSGVGKSGFIGMKMAATLTSLGQRAIFLHPVEAIHGDLGYVSPGDCVIALSFSGESPEMVKLVKLLRQDFDVTVISITKKRNSSLGKISDVTIELPVKEEGSPYGVAPMASTTATLAVGDLIASALTSPKVFRKDHFARLHPGGGLALSLKKVREFMTGGRDTPLIKDSKTVWDALAAMSKKVLGVTGVVNKKGILVGVITDGDIRRFLLSEKCDLNEPLVKAMSRKPKSISTDSTLEAALKYMEKYRITSLFVLNKRNKPVGIIHIHDILGDMGTYR